MRVLLADDHALFLDGLKNLLTLNGVQVVGIARNGLEAFEKTVQLRPEIVLMDIRMPGCDGITATRLIKAERPEVKIVMLTTSTEEPDLLDAIKSGACGYLLKSLETGPFLSYLRGVERDEAAVSREMSGVLLKAVSLQDEAGRPGQEAAGEPRLTQRQVEILQLIAQSLSNKEVADRLSVSEHTVKYHLGEIFQRLHLKNRDQAAEYAMRKGLIRKD
jgi:two-component system NarL family response regulator